MKAPLFLVGCLALIVTASAIAQDNQAYKDQNASPGAYSDQNQPRDQANLPTPQEQRSINLDTQRIDDILGLRGQLSRTGVYIVKVPSRLPNITVAGIPLPAAMTPVSTIAFKNIGNNRTLVSADLILLQSKVNPAIDAALRNGLSVTSLHDPLLSESPRISLLHVQGIAETDRLATAINRVIARSALREAIGREMRESGTMMDSGTQYTCPEDACYTESECPAMCPDEYVLCPSGEEYVCSPSGTSGSVWRPRSSRAMSDGSMDLSTSGVNPSATNLNQDQLENILDARPLIQNRILKFNFAKSTSVNGQRIGWAMGVKSTASFAGNSDRAIVTGDLAVYHSELQGALRALRNADINILSIGTHMTTDSPRVIFVHFMGVGRAADLARGIRNALNVPSRETGTPEQTQTQ